MQQKATHENMFSVLKYFWRINMESGEKKKQGA